MLTPIGKRYHFINRTNVFPISGRDLFTCQAVCGLGKKLNHFLKCTVSRLMHNMHAATTTHPDV